jgi:D-sedoheptulose 7-phosphate isomerase
MIIFGEVTRMIRIIQQEIVESIEVKRRLLDLNLETIERIADRIVELFKSGGRLLVCGNGGSAADAQHLACELVGHFKGERQALPCIALTTDTSILTAVANDYDFQSIFSRQVEALARPGDIVLGISTSGNSPNVVAAMESARRKGCGTILLGGRGGGKMLGLADLAIVVPSDNTQRIQESHVLLIHILCLLIEQHFIPSEIPAK